MLLHKNSWKHSFLWNFMLWRFLLSFLVPFKDTPKFNPRRRMSVLERSASSVTSASTTSGAQQYSANSRIAKGPNSSITSSPANSSTASNHSSLSATTNTTGIGSINGSTGGGASAFSSPHSQPNQHGMQNQHGQKLPYGYPAQTSNNLSAGRFNNQGKQRYLDFWTY